MVDEKSNKTTKQLNLEEEANPFSFKNFLDVNPNRSELKNQFEKDSNNSIYDTLQYDNSLHELNKYSKEKHLPENTLNQFEGLKLIFWLKLLSLIMHLK